VLSYIAKALMAASVLMALAFLLRMGLHWAQVNPFRWFVITLRRLTEPVLAPLRYGFDNRTLRFDMLPLVAAVLVLMNGFFAAYLIGSFGALLFAINFTDPITARHVASWSIDLLLGLYLAVLFVRFLMPILGIGYSSQLRRFCYRATEPILKPLRRFFLVGAFDLSPLVAIFGIQLIGSLLQELINKI
jgi:uncharacterized protein YggT (Ycf19 family)